MNELMFTSLILLFSFLVKSKIKHNEDGSNARNQISFQNDRHQYLHDRIWLNGCLDIGVDLKTDHAKDEEDVVAAPKELLVLIEVKGDLNRTLNRF